jgi:hypothetical protein
MARPSPPSICDRATTTIATAGKRSRTSGAGKLRLLLREVGVSDHPVGRLG